MIKRIFCLAAILAAAPSFAGGPTTNGLLAALPGPEQAYYEQIFDYAMATSPANAPYEWSSYSIAGSLTLGAPYVSKSGYSCRDFTEILQVPDMQATGSGIGCKREGREGWCRLKTGQAATCAMEQSPGFLDDGFSLPSVGNGAGMGSVGAPSGGGGSSSSGVSMPNAPSVGRVNVPTPSGDILEEAGKGAVKATNVAKGWLKDGGFFK